MLAFDNLNAHVLLTPNSWFGGSYAIMESFRHGAFIGSTVDFLISTLCLEEAYPLLYTGKYLVDLESHLGLFNVMTKDSSAVTSESREQP